MQCGYQRSFDFGTLCAHESKTRQKERQRGRMEERQYNKKKKQKSERIRKKLKRLENNNRKRTERIYWQVKNWCHSSCCFTLPIYNPIYMQRSGNVFFPSSWGPTSCSEHLQAAVAAWSAWCRKAVIISRSSCGGHGELKACPGWLVGWLVGWVVGWLGGWLGGWVVGWLVGFISYLSHCVVHDRELMHG